MSARGRGRGRRKAGRASLAPRDLRVRPPAMSECFVTRACEVLDRLQKKDNLSIFLQPVDNEIAPEYDVIVKRKMDFMTMRTKVHACEYDAGVDAFHDDLNLIWSNCLLYNGAELDNVFSKKAVELRKFSDSRLIPAMASALDADKRSLDQWTERHRRRPAASPSGSLPDGVAPTDSFGLGESVAEGGGGGGDAAAAEAAAAAASAADDAAADAEAAARAAARAAKSELDTAAAIAAANEASAAAARKAALREQYGADGDGLWRPPPVGEKERVWFVSVDKPAFRASSVLYDPRSFAAEEDEGSLADSGRMDAYQRDLDRELLAAQRGEGDRVRPVHQVPLSVFVPRRGCELDGTLAGGLGPPPRQNPCRPLSSGGSIKVKDYVQSLQAFVAGAGVIATKIIGELLSPEIAVLREEEMRKKRRREAEAAAAAGRTFEDGDGGDATGKAELTDRTRPKSASRGAHLLPKLSKRIDELDGEDGLEKLVGINLANEVRAVPLEDVNFSMPYGLNPVDMDAIAQFAMSQSNQPGLSFLLQLKSETDLQARRQAAGAQRLAQVSNSQSSPFQRPDIDPQIAAMHEQQGHRMRRLSPSGRSPSPFRAHESPHQQGQPPASRFVPGESPSSSSLMPMSSSQQHMPRHSQQQHMGGSPLQALNLEAQAQAQAAAQAAVQARQAQEAASLAATAQSRAREIETAARHVQARNSAVFAYSNAAAASLPDASPVGAMHDAAMMGTAVPQPMADRIKQLNESYRDHANDAANVATQAAQSVAMGGGGGPGSNGHRGDGPSRAAGDVFQGAPRDTSSAGSGGRGSVSSALHLGAVDGNATCDHCNTKDTPGWRQGPNKGERLCNACGLYFMKHKNMRPSDLWSKKRVSPATNKFSAGTHAKVPRLAMSRTTPAMRPESFSRGQHQSPTALSPHGASRSQDVRQIIDGHASDGVHRHEFMPNPVSLPKSLAGDHLTQPAIPVTSLSNPADHPSSSMQTHMPSMADLLIAKHQQPIGGNNEARDNAGILPSTLLSPNLQAPIDFRDSGVPGSLGEMQDGAGLGRASSPGLPMFMSHSRMDIPGTGDRKADDHQMRGMNVSELVAPSSNNALESPMLDGPSALLDVSPSRASPGGDGNDMDDEPVEDHMVQSLFGLPDNVPDDGPDFGF